MGVRWDRGVEAPGAGQVRGECREQDTDPVLSWGRAGGHQRWRPLFYSQ